MSGLSVHVSALFYEPGATGPLHGFECGVAGENLDGLTGGLAAVSPSLNDMVLTAVALTEMAHYLAAAAADQPLPPGGR